MARAQLTVAKVTRPSSLVTESRTFKRPERVTSDLGGTVLIIVGFPDSSNSVSSRSMVSSRDGNAQSISSRSRMHREGVSERSRTRVWSSILSSSVKKGQVEWNEMGVPRASQ